MNAIIPDMTDTINSIKKCSPDISFITVFTPSIIIVSIYFVAMFIPDIQRYEIHQYY